MVQEAVDTYQERTDGLLPIKTKDQETPVFQKYPIEFSKLKEMNIIGELPGTSFENGGHYQYVIIHPETDPNGESAGPSDDGGSQVSSSEGQIL